MKILEAIGFFFIATPIYGIWLVVNPEWSIPSNAICAEQDLMRAEGHIIDGYNKHPRGLTLDRQDQREEILDNLKRTTLHRLV